MPLEIIRDALAWCSVINIGLLLWWLVAITLLHDWVYKIHSRWFKIPVEKFDVIHYSGMMYFKIGLFLFNIVPYLALRIVL